MSGSKPKASSRKSKGKGKGQSKTAATAPPVAASLPDGTSVASLPMARLQAVANRMAIPFSGKTREELALKISAAIEAAATPPPVDAGASSSSAAGPSASASSAGSGSGSSPGARGTTSAPSLTPAEVIALCSDGASSDDGDTSELERLRAQLREQQAELQEQKALARSMFKMLGKASGGATVPPPSNTATAAAAGSKTPEEPSAAKKRRTGKTPSTQEGGDSSSDDYDAVARSHRGLSAMAVIDEAVPSDDACERWYDSPRFRVKWDTPVRKRDSFRVTNSGAVRVQSSYDSLKTFTGKDELDRYFTVMCNAGLAPPSFQRVWAIIQRQSKTTPWAWRHSQRLILLMAELCRKSKDHELPRGHSWVERATLAIIGIDPPTLDDQPCRRHGARQVSHTAGECDRRSGARDDAGYDTPNRRGYNGGSRYRRDDHRRHPSPPSAPKRKRDQRDK